MSGHRFPPDFVFGVSAAAYQIEGAHREDGKGESIWDRFVRVPGNVEGGHTGDVACDHYHRWEEDLDLIRDAGLEAYRFSVAWPRLFPQGTGAPNEAGFSFYERLIDGCIERGIEPWPCLYHWDYPQALEDRGGWTAPDSVEWFVAYARAFMQRFGGRLRHVVLFNEPSMFCALGYLRGLHAPGKASPEAWTAAVLHVNLATAAAARMVKREFPDVQVGTVLALNVIVPASTAPDDVAAAVQSDAIFNDAFLLPATQGRWPEALADVMPALPAEALLAPLDFIGVNHYTRIRVAADPDQPGSGRVAENPPGMAVTAYGWEIHPDGLREVLHRVRAAAPSLPLYVTENGGAFDDVFESDGRIVDQGRIDLVAGYVAALGRAIDEGCRVNGYFVWSLLDNFEWHHGYHKRFGLVHVDFETLKRTPKASYFWYAALAGGKALA